VLAAKSLPHISQALWIAQADLRGSVAGTHEGIFAVWDRNQP
jgi:hypothetical protein